MDVRSLGDFQDALASRHEFFHSQGCRLSDHGLDHCYAAACTGQAAAQIFDQTRRGQPATPGEHEQFASYLMLFFGHLDAAKGWTKQLHLGALRSVNTRALRDIGPDTGFDSIGDTPQLTRLAGYLDALERENALPQMIVYNLNPADNYTFAAMAGNFPAKLQFGSAWWFLDQKDGIERQLNALSNTGLLSRFVGMLTDSRSFLSYPRHEYFRRVLCNLIGRDVENGELPDSEELLGPMIRDICYANAQHYLHLHSD
jgi:glucuronate isomerase